VRTVLGRGWEYHANVSRTALIEHLRLHGLRLDGPFTLRSGEESDWYLDARQTTFDGEGARLVGLAVLEVLDPDVEAVGGMTLGADPIAVATALVASEQGRPLRAFSIRKSEKSHGLGGRLVGPVGPGTRVAILEDTTTTGSAAGEATDVALAAELIVLQAIALVDRSDGLARQKFGERGISQIALVTPSDLGVGS
jgi:orotate phosphoribosyltransferase